MAERDLSRIAGQEVQAEGDQHVDEQAGHDVEQVVVGHDRKRREEGGDSHEERDLESFEPHGRHLDQTFLIGTAPNRPLGLTTRTRMSRMYVETCLIPALKKYPERFSRTPRSMPPMIAPGMLPNPPRMA